MARSRAASDNLVMDRLNDLVTESRWHFERGEQHDVRDRCVLCELSDRGQVLVRLRWCPFLHTGDSTSVQGLSNARPRSGRTEQERSAGNFPFLLTLALALWCPATGALRSNAHSPSTTRAPAFLVIGLLPSALHADGASTFAIASTAVCPGRLRTRWPFRRV